MAQLPIIRPKPQGGEEHLLALIVEHPNPGEMPKVDFRWDNTWVQSQGLPPAFSQQIFLLAMQIFMSAFLVVCGNVMPPQDGTQQN